MMVFVLNPFKPVTFFQQPKEVAKKGRELPKFFTAKMTYLRGETGFFRSTASPS
jgi:hypothetical protein